MFLKKISISARLILVMSLIAILTAGLSAYLIMRFIDSGQQVKVLAEEGTRGIIWGERANFYLHNLIINFYRANSGDMRWVKAMEDNIPNIRTALDEYEKTAQDPENKRLLVETRAALDSYAEIIYTLGQAYRQGIYGPGIIRVLNELDTKTAANRLITDINNLVEYSKAKAEANRASFFNAMTENTRASIFLACLVVFILICAGYTGVIWTRDEIAEHNEKERLLQKLQRDLLNSLEAAGAISRQIAFATGTLSFVGNVEKVLHHRPEKMANFLDYSKQLHPEDRKRIMGNSPWRDLHQYDDWDLFRTRHPKEFIDVEGRTLLSKDSRFVKEWIRQAGSPSATHKREFRCLSATENGPQWRWKRSLSKLVADPSGLGYAGESGILFDITDEYQIRDELLRAKYDAEAASRAKSDFLARMSHEIRTPMNAIIGMTHLTLRTELNEIQKEYQNKVLSSAQKLLTIINDILDFSKIEAGKMEIETTPFRLDDVLNSLSDVVLDKAHEKQLELIFSISVQTPEWLAGDPLRLGQVLTNLTSNAIKFTSAGDILVEVDVEELTETAARLHFSITDSGIGMTAEQVGSLFKPFTQANGTITRRFGGTGLGLAISKSLVEAMGGSIWVESEPDRGSRFHFTTKTTLVDQPTALTLPEELRRLRVLIIDDNKTARNSIATMMGKLFATEPDTSGCAGEAFQQICHRQRTAQPYNLIFVDWHLPGKNGIETGRLIKEEIVGEGAAPRVILMIDGYAVENLRFQARSAGIDAFLPKPACPSNIVNTVTHLFFPEPSQADDGAVKVSQEKLDQVRGTRVLLVEDNLFNQEVARELLEQAGMVVYIAENGFAALKAVSSSTFDVIFMDIQMPDLDGLEVAKRIREHHQAEDLPIIAVTAHALSEDREKSLAAGMNDHITKPIDPDELMAMLVKWSPVSDVGAVPNSLRKQAASAPDHIGESSEPNLHFKEIKTREGIKRCLGNSASYKRFLRIFFREYCHYGKECDDLFQSGDFEVVRHHAHAIKGPAGSIGAKKLQETAHALEKAIWRRETNRYEHLLRAFQNALSAVMAELHDFVAAEEQTGNDCQSPREAPATPGGEEVLAQLRTCLQENDTAAATLVMNCPPLSNGRDWTLLKKQISDFDFDKALETLVRMKSSLAESRHQDGHGTAENTYC